MSTLRSVARQLRADRTPAESVLWKILRGNRFLGLKFRRQHQFHGVILDFYCEELRLAIELDGAAHLLPKIVERDAERTTRLQKSGLTLIRVENEELLLDSRSVMERIETIVQALIPLSRWERG